MAEAMQLLLDSNRGVYIPKNFIEDFDISKFNLDLSDDMLDDLSNPENEFYWDSWEYVLNTAEYIDDAGNKFILHHDGDLWLVCQELMTEEELTNVYGEY